MQPDELRRLAVAVDAASLREVRRRRSRLVRVKGAALVPAALCLARLARSDDVPGIEAFLARALAVASGADGDALALALAAFGPPAKTAPLLERARASSDPAVAFEAELRAIRLAQWRGELAVARRRLAALPSPPSEWARASAMTLEGLQAIGEGRKGAALEHLERAFRTVAGSNADFEASELAGMIGNVHHDAGALALAVRWYGFAMRHATRAGSASTRAIFALYAGWAHHESGRLAAARSAYAIARRGLAGPELRRFALQRDALAALLRPRGPATKLELARCAQALAQLGDDARATAVNTLAMVLDAHEAAAAPPEIAVVTVLRCSRALAETEAGSDDERIARRMARAALARATARVARRACDLALTEDGAKLRVGRRAISFAKYPTHARLVVALAEATLEGRRLSLAELFAAGWPGERIREDAAVHRVHVALSSMRRRGLAGALPRNTVGYAFEGVRIGLHPARDAKR